MAEYLTSAEVVALHDEIMERTGSPPCPLLHPDKLDSALQRPRWAAHYEQADLVRQAVLLAVGISQAQAFEEGNKRAAFAATDAFLRLNGLAFGGDPIGFADSLISVAEQAQGAARDAMVDQFEQWLRERGAPGRTLSLTA